MSPFSFPIYSRNPGWVSGSTNPGRVGCASYHRNVHCSAYSPADAGESRSRSKTCCSGLNPAEEVVNDLAKGQRRVQDNCAREHVLLCCVQPQDECTLPRWCAPLVVRPLIKLFTHGTDTALAFTADAEWPIAGPVGLGITMDESVLPSRSTFEQNYGCEPGTVRDGIRSDGVRVCVECVAEAPSQGLPGPGVAVLGVPEIRQ